MYLLHHYLDKIQRCHLINVRKEKAACRAPAANNKNPLPIAVIEFNCQTLAVTHPSFQFLIGCKSWF